MLASIIIAPCLSLCFAYPASTGRILHDTTLIPDADARIRHPILMTTLPRAHPFNRYLCSQDPHIHRALRSHPHYSHVHTLSPLFDTFASIRRRFLPTTLLLQAVLLVLGYLIIVRIFGYYLSCSCRCSIDGSGRGYTNQ